MARLPPHVQGIGETNSAACAECVASAARYRGLSDVRDAAQHFERLAPRELGEAGRLGRLLPNINGPDTNVNRLYANVIVSVSLWAALGVSVWADHIERKETAVLLRIQRLPGHQTLQNNSRRYCVNISEHDPRS